MMDEFELEWGDDLKVSKQDELPVLPGVEDNHSSNLFSALTQGIREQDERTSPPQSREQKKRTPAKQEGAGVASDTDSDFEMPNFLKQKQDDGSDDEFAIMDKGEEFKPSVASAEVSQQYQE